MKCRDAKEAAVLGHYPFAGAPLRHRQRSNMASIAPQRAVGWNPGAATHDPIY